LVGIGERRTLLGPNAADHATLVGDVHAGALEVLSEPEDEVGVVIHERCLSCRLNG
jgi:hypothetical protein